MGFQVNTAALFYRKVRILVAEKLEAKSSGFAGEIELEESYLGGVRKGNRGRGAAGKVYTQIIDNTRTDTVMPIIRCTIKPDSIVYTDSNRSYNALDITKFKHYRINHSKLFANGRNHINGIETFWNQAKRVLRKYNGIPAKQFYWFLKNCEFRFNYGSHHQQFKALKKWCNL